jgi:hypothetical protein
MYPILLCTKGSYIRQPVSHHAEIDINVEQSSHLVTSDSKLQELDIVFFQELHVLFRVFFQDQSAFGEYLEKKNKRTVNRSHHTIIGLLTGHSLALAS